MSQQIRSKKSTLSNSVATMAMAGTMLQPDQELTPRQLFHFQNIIKSRELETWSPYDITIACQLAISTVRLEQINLELNSDGLVIENKRGTPIPNPLLGACMTQTSTVQSLTRTLGLGASQRGVAGSVQTKRNEAERDARAIISRVSTEDSLLA